MKVGAVKSAPILKFENQMEVCDTSNIYNIYIQFNLYKN